MFYKKNLSLLPIYFFIPSFFNLVDSCILRNWIYRWTMARPHIKIELWPLIYSSPPRKSTHYLQYPAQRVSVLSLSQICKMPNYYHQQQSRKAGNNSYNNLPQMFRTSLISDSFANFCPYFQFKTNQNKNAQSLSHVQLFCNPMDCSLPGSSVHGILQARVLERVAISSSRGSSQPRDWTHISCISLHWQEDSLPLNTSVIWASLLAQVVKNLPAVQETWVWSLSQKDPLQKGMATYSSILAWRIPWTEEPGGLQSIGSQRFGHDWTTNTFTSHGL